MIIFKKSKVVLSIIAIVYSVSLSAQVDSIALRMQQYFLRERDSITRHCVGTAFVPFSATSLDGKIINEKQMQGKVTVIDFWFQACNPCMREIEALKNLYAKFKGQTDFQFISFTFDPKEIAERVVHEHQLPYLVCLITRDESYRLNLNSGFPTKMIIDKEGNIAFYKMGSSIEEEWDIMRRKIAALLDEK